MQAKDQARDPLTPLPPMRRIVVSLLKGGVAKSETSVHLAHGLALAGYRVLLVDTDVQSHCAEMLGVEPRRGLADLIAGWAEPLEALALARENLWLLAGGNDLAAVKMEIARREMAPEAVLAEALECYEGRFHFMVMDTAPGWDTLLVNALYCSQEVLAPVSMEPMAISGLKRFEERLEVIRKYKPSLCLRWVLPTFVDGRVKKSGEILAQLRERYGQRLADPVRYSVKLSEATAFGQTVFEHDPKGAGAQAYRQLVERVAASERPGVGDEAPADPARGLSSRPAPAPAPPAMEIAEAAPPPSLAPAAVADANAREAAPDQAPPAPPPCGGLAEGAGSAQDQQDGLEGLRPADAVLCGPRRQPLSHWLQRSHEPPPAEPSAATPALAAQGPANPGPEQGLAHLWGRRLSQRMGLLERLERREGGGDLAGEACVKALRESLVKHGRP